jgi:hypothetical protein
VVAVDVPVGEDLEDVVSWRAAAVDAGVDDVRLSHPATAAARQIAAARATIVPRGRGSSAIRSTVTRRSLKRT